MQDTEEEKFNNTNNKKKENDNLKFYKLTPEILEEDSVYNKALDYALENDDIKNIAISGIYGSGKTTVWESYVKQRELENIITVSLGKYKDKYIKNDTSQENEIENRTEKQIINQILVQINKDSIPLSKYKFKTNNSEENIFLNILNSVLFIVGIFIWLSRKELTILTSVKNLDDDTKLCLIIIWGFIMVIPLFYFFNKFYRYSKFKLSKINVKGTEANFNEDKENDETIFDKDIKELVYILSNSKTKIVVFEDLDRYDNLDIFTKLRELNFLVNKYNENNNLKYSIKFIYMVKDELFDSKTRTKFFDFIISIIPFIDSKNSENMLLKLLEGVDNKPNSDTIFKISLYIDDMRLLKNIVNEFIIYSNIISIEKLELVIDKLFALVVLKNVCPKEFDDLQKNQGYIYEILHKTKEYYTLFLENKIKDIEKRINALNNEIEFDEFELISLMLPSDVRCIRTDEPWIKILKKWYKDKETTKEIKDGDTNYTYNYYEFIEKYIKVKDSKEISQKIKQVKEKEIEKLKIEKKEINSKLEKIKLQCVKDILSNISYGKREEIFNKNIEQIENKDNLGFIHFIILEGLLNETYYYYKGIFYEGYLGKNDTIYLRNLLEGNKQDSFLNLENPQNVLKRLTNDDFSRPNILNKDIFKQCLINNDKNKILSISKVVSDDYFLEYRLSEDIKETLNLNYYMLDLVIIISEFSLDDIKKYIHILYNNQEYSYIEYILEKSESEREFLFSRILCIILTIENNDLYGILKLPNFINSMYQRGCYNSTLSELKDREKTIFYQNLKLTNIKIDFVEIRVQNDKIEIEHILQIEKINAYVLNIDNVKYIVDRILDTNINYGYLITTIYKEKALISMKNYINENFDSFISLYINPLLLDEGNKFTNEESEVVMILNSSIEDELKLKYCENNETIITDLSKINNLKSECNILNFLFRNNKIQFSLQNISTYYNLDKKYWCEEFVNFINRNIILHNNDIDDILKANIEVCNNLINDDNLSKEAFDIIIDFVNEKIDKLDSKLIEYKVCKLIDKNLLNINSHNLQILLSNKYKEAITKLLKNSDIDIIDMLIKDANLKEKIDLELIYTLANSSISEDYVIKLIEVTKENILLENISNDKIKIIEYIIDNDLSEENKNYIIQNFKDFNLKDYFLDKLEDDNELSNLDNSILKDDLMEYILKYDNIHIDTKINLIVTKIENCTENSKIEKYIKSVNEISKLSSIFNNSRLSIKDIDDYNKRIVYALVEYEYAKITKNDNLLLNKNIKL